MEELQRNLHNVKLVNTNTTEYNSIEHLEAARYAETCNHQGNPPAHVRPSRSLYFSEQKSRTWNQSDMKRFRNTGETEASRLSNKRLSISSFRYEDTGCTQRTTETAKPRPQTGDVTYQTELPQQPCNIMIGTNLPSDKRMLHRSKSCDRAKDTVVKTFKISSDKIQANLSKFSNSIHNKLDEKGKCKLSVNCISSDDPTTDFYKPAVEPDNEDPSAGFCDLARDCIAPTPTSSLQRSQNNKLSRDPAHNKQKSPLQNGALKTFSCTESEDLRYRPGLSMTMRSKIHTANKKLSMIRSRSMDRFSRRQEVIPVTPRQRPTAAESQGFYHGPFIGQARAVVDFTPNPYDREALRLQKGDLIDIINTNASGLWRGRCNGKVGNFKFVNVETLPNRAEPNDNKADARWSRVRSVQEFLINLDMEEYISVFVLNGFETVEALKTLDEAELDYLGIKDPDHQHAILMAVGSIFSTAEHQFIRGPERDSGCYMSDRLTSCGDHEVRSQGPGPSSSESGVSEEEFQDRRGRSSEEELYQSQERVGRNGRNKSTRTLHVTNATRMMHGLPS
eukprot:TRINITY_DN16825_c0_g1_i1.p1 TRINITY_DN16825_c0_g1~~TRINITY_DN16825_c0_g1_i1.p1  ORF type:complete len:563 (-),score=138.93 TRINITY_DN16825_c0_g1_i1:64-1752(-)